jgi:pSer/pThr/pTyr-binding forkhead associated (FHA) protein
MAKFIVKFNNEVVDHIDLGQGDMKIGRRPGSDIHLDNLAVSGTHANIFTIGEDSFIEDLNSTNGTLVNNKKITKHHLRNGDSVLIGKHELIYVSDDQAESPTESNDFAKTVIINPGAVSAPPPAASAPPPASGTSSATRPAAIFVLSGANSGKRIDLTKSVTSLGRTGRKSGTITKTDEGYRLAPVPDSDDAPTLNGRPIPAGGVPLKNGDVVEVAGTRLQFYYK